MDINPRQFTAYRGLLVDTGRAPEDVDEILSRLRPKGRDSTAYGPHWTTNPEVARNFATNPTAGGYETTPAKMRKFSGNVDRWGVVLEAQAKGRGYNMTEPYSDHEAEVRVHHPDLDHPAANHAQSVRAHLYEMSSYASLAEKIPPGPGAGRARTAAFRQGFNTPARSFDVPREHWS